MPVEFYSDFIKKQSAYDANLEEEYLNIKNINNIDAKFVQRYIVEEDIESLTREIEKNWKESLKTN